MKTSAATPIDRSLIIIGAIVLLSVLAGCIYAPQSDTPDVNAWVESNRTGNTTEITGGVSLGSGLADEDVVYTDLKVQFYTEEGSLICSIPLGTLSSSEGHQFATSRSMPPHYITFESPDFWTGVDSVDYFEYNPDTGRYAYRDATTAEEMPVWNPDETGPECPTGTERS